MRRAGVLVALAVAIAAPAAAAAAPALRVVTRTPLLVAGSHFHPREKVKVSAGTTSLVVRTTTLGTFRADLGTPSGDPCSLNVLALGARGERVFLPLATRAMCAPAAPAATP